MCFLLAHWNSKCHDFKKYAFFWSDDCLLYQCARLISFSNDPWLVANSEIVQVWGAKGIWRLLAYTHNKRHCVRSRSMSPRPCSRYCYNILSVWSCWFYTHIVSAEKKPLGNRTWLAWNPPQGSVTFLARNVHLVHVVRDFPFIVDGDSCWLMFIDVDQMFIDVG